VLVLLGNESAVASVSTTLALVPCPQLRRVLSRRRMPSVSFSWKEVA
jgi:hypothetical protein